MSFARRILAALTDRDVPALPEGQHLFTIDIFLRGHGADWGTPLVTQEIRANTLQDALLKATNVPLNRWFPPEFLDDSAEVARIKEQPRNEFESGVTETRDLLARMADDPAWSGGVSTLFLLRFEQQIEWLLRQRRTGIR